MISGTGAAESQLSSEARRAVVGAIRKAEKDGDFLQIPDYAKAEIFHWVACSEIETGGASKARDGEETKRQRDRSVVFHGDIFHKPTPQYSR